MHKPGQSEGSLWVVDPKLSMRVALIDDSQRLASRFLAYLRRETAVEVLKLVGPSKARPRQALLAMTAEFDLDRFLDRTGFTCVMEELGSGTDRRVVYLWLIPESGPGQAVPQNGFPRKRRGPA